MKQLITLVALLVFNSGAAAEVTDSAENGFTTAHEVTSGGATITR
jgi:hypothetical protein